MNKWRSDILCIYSASRPASKQPGRGSRSCKWISGMSSAAGNGPSQEFRLCSTAAAPLAITVSLGVAFVGCRATWQDAPTWVVGLHHPITSMSPLSPTDPDKAHGQRRAT
jgi:hypothetical protein